MPNRLLTEEERENLIETSMTRGLDAVACDWALIKAQDAKTLKAACREFGEWLESKMFAVPLMGVEWHIRLDHIEALKRGEMPE